MNWISVKDRLPEDKTYVLIHITRDNWNDGDAKNSVYFQVAKFVRGISMAEREKLPWDDSRKNLYGGGDQAFNNTVPYYWTEFGPGSFFGQEVDYWMPIPELPTEVKP